MVRLLKCGLLILFLAITFWQVVEESEYVLPQNKEIIENSDKRDNSELLVFLATMNNEALPVNTLQEGSMSMLTYRYLPRNNFSIVLEEYKCIFPSRFKFVSNDYLENFARRQDVGYYVFVLREIIV